MAERQIVCAECGATFTASSPRARLCSQRCRSRASAAGRVRQAASVTSLQPRDASSHAKIVDAARAELEAAGRADSALGLSALALAARIDTGLDTGSAMASAVKMFTDTMAAAMKGAEAASTLDELKARRRAKRGA